MKIFATALQKGGVGKTSIALALACELAKKGTVILVDADPQGNSTGALLENVEHEFADYLFGSCKIEDVSTETKIKNLYILPTVPIRQGMQSTGINKLRTYKQTSAALNPFAMVTLTQELSKYFDYCIFDTSPAFDFLEENIFSSCDEVIGIIRPDQFSNDGLTIFFENLKDFRRRKITEKPNFSKIVLNGYDARYNFHHQLREILEKQSEYKTFVIPADPAFTRSQVSQCSIFEIKETKKETLSVLNDLAESLTK